jgi:hypothetical protein
MEDPDGEWQPPSDEDRRVRGRSTLDSMGSRLQNHTALIDDVGNTIDPTEEDLVAHIGRQHTEPFRQRELMIAQNQYNNNPVVHPSENNLEGIPTVTGVGGKRKYRRSSRRSSRRPSRSRRSGRRYSRRSGRRSRRY